MKLLHKSLNCFIGGFPSVKGLDVILFLKDIFRMNRSINAKKGRGGSSFLVRTPYLHANKIQLKKMKI